MNMVDNLIMVMLLGFAVYRLSRMVARENGPFDVLDNFRLWLGKHAQNRVFKTIADLFNCPYCLGVWFSALSVTLVHSTTISGYFIDFLAIAGLQTFLQAVEDKE